MPVRAQDPDHTTAASARAARTALAAGVLVLGMFGGACARPPGAAAPSGPPRAVVLRVESRNSADIVVFAERGGARQRLGTVTAFTQATFRIPTRFTDDAGAFTLFASPIGGTPPLRTPPLNPARGQEIVWTLEPQLERSMAVYANPGSP